MSRFKRWIPLLRHLEGYQASDAKHDALAGLTVAIMLIPQGMAYAMLAGLPPYIGLYASIIPTFLYAVFGTSRRLSFGPVAMDSLLVATGVGAIAAAGSTDYIALAITLAVMVGLLQIVMGLARMGFLVNFLSRPVIGGFTSAAALIIGLSQLKHLLGVKLQRSNQIHVLLWDVVQKVSAIHWLTLGLGLAAIAILWTLKKRAPQVPGALVVVVLGTLAVWLFGLHTKGMSIVAKVPAGLPSLSWPRFDLATLRTLLPTALTIALVAFLEAISVGRALATKHGNTLDANQELLAMGIANLGGGLTGGYPGTGGFSRSAVNDQAGARTGIASMITALLIAITLLFFTKLFYFLPNAVLAAIVMVAVFGLFKPKEPFQLWKIQRLDAGLWVLTFAVTLTVGIQQGILVGVVASLLVFVARSTRPHTAQLGRIPGTQIYRNIERFPDAETWDDIVIFRLDASFYFANVAFFKDKIEAILNARETTLKAVILDTSGMNFLDTSAEAALRQILNTLQEKEVALYLAAVKGPVRDMLYRTGLLEALGESHLTLQIQDAVDAVRRPPSHPCRQVFETGICRQKAGITSQHSRQFPATHNSAPPTRHPQPLPPSFRSLIHPH